MTSSLVVAVALVIVLLALAGLHVYWGIGGRWGRSGVTPQVSGRAALKTGPWACAVVAALLATAAGIVAARGGLFVAPLPSELVTFACWMVAVAFALRAVGDFRLFGLFRRIKGTAFARNDARLFTPLCLLLAVACAWVALGAGASARHT